MSAPKFVTGSTRRHVLVMTSTASVGLLAMFAVDLTDLFFLSMLGQLEVAAAGFAWSLTFFVLSVCIGLSIAATALTSRALGAGGVERARRWAVNSAAGSLLVTVPLALLGMATAPWLLELLGAHGETHRLALAYLNISLAGAPIMGLGMVATGVLRAVGDARRGMYATLVGSVVNAVLDPLLIFGLELGIHGAAIATVLARAAMLAYAGYVVIGGHRLLARFVWADFVPDLRPMLAIALPAILTNVATPIGQAYVTAAAARFGDDAVAGIAIIGRIAPMAFVALFAMSGAVGPIIGQNFGAGRFDRLEGTLRESLGLATLYTLLVSALLWVGQGWLVEIFNAQATAGELLGLFCTWIAPVWVFAGASFITNAAFNNLGKAYLATVFNLGKATLGTIPFVAAGAALMGAPGVLIGQTVGSVLFGVAGTVTAFWLIRRLAGAAPPAG